eukprot:gene26503-biopygen3745
MQCTLFNNVKAYNLSATPGSAWFQSKRSSNKSKQNEIELIQAIGQRYRAVLSPTGKHQTLCERNTMLHCEFILQHYTWMEIRLAFACEAKVSLEQARFASCNFTRLRFMVVFFTVLGGMFYLEKVCLKGNENISDPQVRAYCVAAGYEDLVTGSSRAPPPPPATPPLPPLPFYDDPRS